MVPGVFSAAASRFLFFSARKKTKICNIRVRLPGNRADLSSPNSSVFLSMACAVLCRSNNKLLYH